MRTLLTILVVIAVLGGGYYWYMQSTVAPAMQNEMGDPFGSMDTNTVPPPTNTFPPGAVMEDGTISEPVGSGAMMEDVMTEDEGAMMEEEGAMEEEPVSAVKEFIVTGRNFSFAPNTIAVKRGDRVRIVFENAGGTHDWRLEGYDVGTRIIQGGQNETIEFVADQTGEFEYYCSVGNHRGMGMVGTLTVTE